MAFKHLAALRRADDIHLSRTIAAQKACKTLREMVEGPHEQMAEMLVRDNKRMRKAGLELAEAAMRVVCTYDGIHRLTLAVAEWCKAIAAEGDRPHPDGR